ncbi:MAG: hypothetical protein GQ557_00125 [Mycoplasmataceae bacterium]|nr:hypothetical protein [Mycoplasmataceae bacterium]
MSGLEYTVDTIAIVGFVVSIAIFIWTNKKNNNLRKEIELNFTNIKVILDNVTIKLDQIDKNVLSRYEEWTSQNSANDGELNEELELQKVSQAYQSLHESTD